MISREYDIELTVEEEMSIIRTWCLKRPDLVKILLENPKGSCQFPTTCKQFPCKKLTCNADCCDNGNTYRMS